jgi:hypothetical protein
MRYSIATFINIRFTLDKSGGGPGSSGAVSIDEQAVKPMQITRQRVECNFLKNVQPATRAFRIYFRVAQSSGAGDLFLAGAGAAVALLRQTPEKAGTLALDRPILP